MACLTSFAEGAGSNVNVHVGTRHLWLMQAAADKLWPTEGLSGGFSYHCGTKFDGEMLSHNPANPAGAAALLVRIARTIASSRPGLNPHTLTVRLRLRGLVRVMLARDSAYALQSARPPEPSRRWNNSNTSP